MANQKISQFTYTSVITGDELIGVAINGQNKAISIGQIIAMSEQSDMNKYQNNRLDAIERALHVYEYNVDANKDIISGIKSDIEGLQLANEEIMQNIDIKLTYRADELQNSIDRINTNSDNIAHVQSDVIALNHAIGTLGTRVTNAQEVIYSHTSAITYLHEGLIHLSNDMYGTYGPKLENLISYTYENVYPVVDNIYERVGNLESASDSTNSALEDYKTSNDARVGVIESNIETLSNNIDNTYTNLQSQIDTINQTIVDNVNSNNDSKENLQNQINELNDYTQLTYANLQDLNTKFVTTYLNTTEYINAKDLELNTKIDELHAQSVSYAYGNIALIYDNISKLQEFDQEYDAKINAVTHISDTALNLAKEHTEKLSQLESHYIVVDNRLEQVERDHDGIYATINAQGEAIHVLQEHVETLEEETVPILKEKDKQTNERIDDIVNNVIPELKETMNEVDSSLNDKINALTNLIGAKNLVESVKLTYDDIESIKETVIGRILQNEDDISHIAWHESHPETSVWSEFGVLNGCGYRTGTCKN